MPQQELFFDQQAGDRRIEILKTYDQRFAQEVFVGMDEPAQSTLWKTLDIENNYDSEDIPDQQGTDASDFLWEEVLQAAREDGSLLSFFVVNEAWAGTSHGLYVSPDWPSAEAFAKQRISAIIQQ